jgi:ArsR family transcriptional regulator
MDSLSSAEALRAFKAVADPNRLRLLRLLSAGPFHVAELTEILGLGQSTVSRHLRILSEAGLVEVRRAGTWSWYSLRPAPSAHADLPARLLELLEELPAVNGDAGAVDRVLAKRRHATSEFFRRTAPVWDIVRESTLGPATHLDRLLELAGAGDTVADLGTGTGILLGPLASRFAHVIGVDASQEMLDEAGQREDVAARTGVELRLGRLEHLPLADGEADTMIANLVLHHVADPPGVLREIRRGLSREGRLVIADLEEYENDSLREALGAHWPGFRPESVRAWIAAAGFDQVRSERIEPQEGAGDRPALHVFEAVAR